VAPVFEEAGELADRSKVAEERFGVGLIQLVFPLNIREETFPRTGLLMEIRV
jgi:hypothetical protein